MSSVGSSLQKGDIWVIVRESTVWLFFCSGKGGGEGRAFHKTARSQGLLLRGMEVREGGDTQAVP
jgi:hypothetical protein